MRATILVVDDTEANISLIQSTLLDEYYVVLTAKNAIEAFQILKTNNVDVILLDIMMPKINGYKACEKIKSNPKTRHIPIVIMTSLTDIKSRLKSLEAGADEFLVKPINNVILFARIKSLVRMKYVADELLIRSKASNGISKNSINIKKDLTRSNILIIDNDLVQSSNIKNLCQDICSNIEAISDIDQINNILENFIPDLCIISCEMENIDSLRLCVLLKAKAQLRYCSIILVAQEEHQDIWIKGMDIGANDYLFAGCDPNEVIARVKTQLKRKLYYDSLVHNIEDSVNLSIKDSLTNLFNRRYFDKHIKYLIKQTKSSGSCVVMMVDIDSFKSINDQFGHPAGDHVIKSVAKILRDNLRVTDLVARYGGDEFIIVMPKTLISNAKNIAERIILKIKQAKLKSQTTLPEITLSIGLSEYKGNTAEDVLLLADQALYKSKSNGGNRVSYL